MELRCHRQSIAAALHTPQLALRSLPFITLCRSIARRQGSFGEVCGTARHRPTSTTSTQRCGSTPLRWHSHIPTATASADVQPSTPAVSTSFWQWRGHSIRYQQCGNQGPAVLLIHGFGANWYDTCTNKASPTTYQHSDHWRKNLPVLGQTCRVFAIDLLGYGYSDKPDPRTATPNSVYNFENWGQQALDFLDQVVGGPALIVTNRVGGLVGLQAAVQAPSQVPAVMVINISLRMLHVEKQAPWQRPLVATLQRVLRESELGRWFFASVAKPQV